MSDLASASQTTTPAPLLLKGSAALSDFRRSRFLDDMLALNTELSDLSIDAVFVYALDLASPLSPSDREKTHALLCSHDELASAEAEQGFFVTPRKGTISPWSSKATDIFHNCALTHVKRVERGILYRITQNGQPVCPETLGAALGVIYDRMIEGVYVELSDLFAQQEPSEFETVDILAKGIDALTQANQDWGLALSEDEIQYLFDNFTQLNRNPTDVELVMFGQANSEHCRHKIFNADWKVDGETKSTSLFNMIRNTHKLNPEGTLIAYSDNSGGMEGFDGHWFEVDRISGEHRYDYTPTSIDIIMKVETHNHPTAISPFPGAATGVGGEIRDEGATGTGSKSKAGLAAFMVSNLRIPGFEQPWEKNDVEFPDRLATPLEIMTEGPIGGASFGNEFGRPNLCGIFKTYEDHVAGRYRGYHKPIMTAGGMGNIKREHVDKKTIVPGAKIVQLGGPAMRIGIGGGAASSMDTGSNALELDFNSVQRGNPEMERRCQEVIDGCVAMDSENPILSIHDVGAGGLSNACPELVEGVGARFELRKVNNEEPGMSPMEVWCNESQERYMLAVDANKMEKFIELCDRERCPYAVIGEATGDDHLTLTDERFGNTPIDMPLQVLLGKPPKMLRDVTHVNDTHENFAPNVPMSEAVERVLRLPAVANKTFLITIADRSITGLVARDQMVGPYQTPVANCALTMSDFQSANGEAMAMGERTNIAVVNAPASGRMAIGESLTNIAAAPIGSIKKIRLSANWMAACGEEGEDANLWDTVEAVGMELCPALGISIPVGKDSMSMRTVWQDSQGQDQKMVAPLSLLITAFAPVQDTTLSPTPDFKATDSSIVLIDLGRGKNRLGGSALAQVYNEVGVNVPDVDTPEDLRQAFMAVQALIADKKILAYHDRGDGGLFVTLAEMGFASRKGFCVDISALGGNDLATLFNEELGMVLEVANNQLSAVHNVLAEHGLAECIHVLGSPTQEKQVVITNGENEIYRESLTVLNRLWSETTYRMQSHRDNPICAQEEYDNLLDENDPGMRVKLSFDPDAAPAVSSGARLEAAPPKMAILREQGINGQVEMGNAFYTAGFDAIDVHMTDLHEGRVDLADFVGLVACGGFSYGDVLGAGSGWGKSVLYNPKLYDMFSAFFAREETFSLGVCNGCQMLSQLKDIIPGAEHWPTFTRNVSEQFEARFVNVEILNSPSVFFKGMEGSIMPIPVAHGEGHANFSTTGDLDAAGSANLLAMRYVDNYGAPAQRYPFNPNGSPDGITSLTTPDGRATVMMPHPERAFQAKQLSYNPNDTFKVAGPWLKMFQNAREFVS